MISVQWANEAHTAILYRFGSEWIWSELQSARRIAMKMQLAKSGFSGSKQLPEDNDDMIDVVLDFSQNADELPRIKKQIIEPPMGEVEDEKPQDSKKPTTRKRKNTPPPEQELSARALKRADENRSTNRVPDEIRLEGDYVCSVGSLVVVCGSQFSQWIGALFNSVYEYDELVIADTLQEAANYLDNEKYEGNNRLCVSPLMLTVSDWETKTTFWKSSNNYSLHH